MDRDESALDKLRELVDCINAVLRVRAFASIAVQVERDAMAAVAMREYRKAVLDGSREQAPDERSFHEGCACTAERIAEEIAERKSMEDFDLSGVIGHAPWSKRITLEDGRSIEIGVEVDPYEDCMWRAFFLVEGGLRMGLNPHRNFDHASVDASHALHDVEQQVRKKMDGGAR